MTSFWPWHFAPRQDTLPPSSLLVLVSLLAHSCISQQADEAAHLCGVGAEVTGRGRVYKAAAASENACPDSKMKLQTPRCWNWQKVTQRWCSGSRWEGSGPQRKRKLCGTDQSSQIPTPCAKEPRREGHGASSILLHVRVHQAWDDVASFGRERSVKRRRSPTFV